MKTIELTKGQVALVDDEDFEWLNSFKWHVHKDNYKEKYNHGYYAVRKMRKNGKEYMQFMHRLIFNINDSGIMIDHVNGNKLDNRRENLRIATKSENGQNRRKQINNKSGFMGVFWHKGFNKYRAVIMFNGKTLYLGLYICPVKAAKAYDCKALELFGENAKLNFKEGNTHAS